MTVPEHVRDVTEHSRGESLSCKHPEVLAQILADYLERVERGESVDISAIVAEHPELADELRENFAKLAALHRAAVGMTDGGETLDQLCLANFTELKTLGDFRLIQPIGRGGMGVVYEAEQISLSRRVALKTLPVAAVLDPKQLARFKNEALAAASLDHPQIVSVYAVGADRGIHYYAMQFIEGLSLAEVVEQLKGDCPNSARQNGTVPLAPALASDTAPVAALSTLNTSSPRERFREIARLGIQAAEALHYAHEMGLVHRDVKPSNLLLDNDGKLHVTDFGLAMTRSGSDLTMSGDLLGTLRYMSPEQASGRRALIDRRTDIYSLGASLYELATLQPAFPEEDRTKLLQQVASESPQPPSQINRAIPKDLETIILKAMVKKPAGRYETSQDLADDLRRYLNDEPICARRPSRWERVAKWSRRHRHVVTSIFVMLVLSVIGLSVGALLISQQRDVARLAAVEAKTQRTRAEENLRQARAAVDSMITKMAEELADRPQMDRVRRELLEKALQFYLGFLHESDDDPEIRYETALTHGRIFDIYQTLGEFDKLLTHGQAEHRMALALHQQFPNDARYHELLARSCARLGQELVYLNRFEGEVYLDTALAEWIRLSKNYPTNPLYRKEIAAWHLIVFSREDSVQGIARATKGLRLLDDLERDFPECPKDNLLRVKGHNLLGDYCLELSRVDEAEEHLRRALEMDEDQADTYRLTRLLLRRRAFDEAEEVLQKVIRKQEQLQKEHPDSYSPDNKLAVHLGLRADLRIAAGRWNEAEEAARRRLEIDTRWFNRYPEEKRLRQKYAWSVYDLGHVLFGMGKHENARDNYQRGIALLESLAEDFPDSPTIQDYLAWVLSTCPEKELRKAHRAINVARRALELSPENPTYWATLARAQYAAGECEAVLASTEKSEKYFDGRLLSDSKLVLAMAHCQLGESRRGREIYREVVGELEDKDTYISEGYTTEFRVLRADADQMVSESPM